MWAVLPVSMPFTKKVMVFKARLLSGSVISNVSARNRTFPLYVMRLQPLYCLVLLTVKPSGAGRLWSLRIRKTCSVFRGSKSNAVKQKDCKDHTHQYVFCHSSRYMHSPDLVLVHIGMCPAYLSWISVSFSGVILAVYPSVSIALFLVLVSEYQRPPFCWLVIYVCVSVNSGQFEDIHSCFLSVMSDEIPSWCQCSLRCVCGFLR